MQPSRRAFLLGRRPVQTPWARFIQRLTLLCQGPCATWARPARTARAAGWRPRARATWPTPGRCAPSTAWPGAGRRGGNRRWSLPAGGSREPQRPGPPGRRHAPRWRAQLRRAAGGAGASRPAAVRRPARRHDAGRMAGGASRLAGGTLRAVRGPGGRRGAGRRGGGNLGAFWRERRTAAALGHAAAAGAGAVPAERTGPDAAACAVGGAWAVVTGWTRCGHRRPPRSTWRICCWGTAARWPGCRRCCSRPCRRPGKRQAATRRRWTMRPGRRDAGWMPGSRRCSTRMVVFPYSLSRNSGGPRAAGKMGWPRRRGLADGRGPRPQPYRAGRRRNKFPLSCTSTCFSPIPWMPIFAKPPSNITSSGAPAKSPSPPTKQLTNQRDLALAYSPGVAAACEEIVADPANVFRYTARGNLVGVITNGTAVLGLGNIGALASAGDGRQGGAVQEVRRPGCVRHRDQRDGPGQAGGDHRRSGGDVRRDQSGGHQGAGVFHGGAQAARADEDPGVPR